MVPKPQPTPSVDVCVITTIHPPFNARIYTRELLALVEAGYSSALVAPWSMTPESDPRIFWVPLRSPKRRSERILHGWRTFRAASKVHAKAYHFHDLDFLPWALLLKWQKKVPVVYDCHENYPEEVRHNKLWIPRALRPVASGITRLFENFSVKQLKHVIVPVPSLQQRFGEFSGMRIQQVRNLARWNARKDLQHEKALIFTGGLLVSYGAQGLLEIMRELKRRGRSYPLIVVDRFESEALREEFRVAIEIESLPISIVPKVNPSEMDRLLSRAWIGLATEMDTPDRRLSLPTKLFEYMAMGLPVVASGIPHSREVVEASGNGIVVPPADWMCFTDAVERLWEDAAFRDQCRESGFKAVEGEFSWVHEQKRLVAYFATFLGAPTNTPEPVL